MPPSWTLVRLSLAVVAASVAMTGTAATATPTPAVPAGFHNYSGSTSTDVQVQFQIVRKKTGHLKLAGWFIFAPLTCDDGTVVSDQAYGYGFTPGPKLAGRRLDHTADGLSVEYRIVGTFRNHTASGWLTLRVAAFTAGGTPQSCSTGQVDWTATT